MCVCAESRTEGSKGGGGLVLEMALRKGGKAECVCARACANTKAGRNEGENCDTAWIFVVSFFPPKKPGGKK